MALGDYRQIFNEASGLSHADDYGFHGHNQDFDANPRTQNGMRIKNMRDKLNGKGMFSTNEAQENSRKDHARHMMMTHALSETIDMAKYGNALDAPEWEDHCDKTFNSLYDTTQNTVFLGDNDEVYYSSVNANGDIEYYMVTDDGPVRAYDKQDISTIPDGAITFDSMDAIKNRRIFHQTNENGEIELVNSHGKKLSDTDIDRVKQAASMSGKSMEEITSNYEDFKKNTAAADNIEHIEDADTDANAELVAATDRLEQNYTPENYLDREIALLNKASIGAEAKMYNEQLSADEQLQAENDKDNFDHRTEELTQLKTDLAGMSPAEANQMMANEFGDKYDMVLAQKNTLDQNVQAENTSIENTSRETITRSGLTSSINMSGAFANAATPATTAPESAPTPQEQTPVPSALTQG